MSSQNAKGRAGMLFITNNQGIEEMLQYIDTGFEKAMSDARKHRKNSEFEELRPGLFMFVTVKKSGRVPTLLVDCQQWDSKGYWRPFFVKRPVRCGVVQFDWSFTKEDLMTFVDGRLRQVTPWFGTVVARVRQAFAKGGVR